MQTIPGGGSESASAQAGEVGGWEWERVKRWWWYEMKMTNWKRANGKKLTGFRHKFTVNHILSNRNKNRKNQTNQKWMSNAAEVSLNCVAILTDANLL